MPEWRNWQTQWTQNPPLATTCEFESRLGHHILRIADAPAGGLRLRFASAEVRIRASPSAIGDFGIGVETPAFSITAAIGFFADHDNTTHGYGSPPERLTGAQFRTHVRIEKCVNSIG